MLGTCASQFSHPSDLTQMKLEDQVPGWVRGGSRDEVEAAPAVPFRPQNENISPKFTSP